MYLDLLLYMIMSYLVEVDEPKEKMEECTNDFMQAKLTANLQNVFATVPESEMSDESTKAK